MMNIQSAEYELKLDRNGKELTLEDKQNIGILLEKFVRIIKNKGIDTSVEGAATTPAAQVKKQETSTPSQAVHAVSHAATPDASVVADKGINELKDGSKFSSHIQEILGVNEQQANQFINELKKQFSQNNAGKPRQGFGKINNGIGSIVKVDSLVSLAKIYNDPKNSFKINGAFETAFPAGEIDYVREDAMKIALQDACAQIMAKLPQTQKKQAIG